MFAITYIFTFTPEIEGWIKVNSNIFLGWSKEKSVVDIWVSEGKEVLLFLPFKYDVYNYPNFDFSIDHGIQK